MVIATLRKHGRRGGKTVEYAGGVYRSGGKTLSVPELAELDRKGELEWAEPRMRAWVLGLPDDGELPAPSAFPVPRRRLTAEQIRIICYIVVGMVAVVLILVLGPSSGTEGASSAPALPLVSSSPGASTEVVHMRGIADGKSSTFQIGGTVQELAWQATTRGPGMQALFCVVPSGTTQPERDFVRVAAYADGSGVTTLRLAAGAYYVKVFATDCSWSLSVTDKK